MRPSIVLVMLSIGCNGTSMPDMGENHFCDAPETVPSPFVFAVTVAEGGPAGGVVAGAQVEVRARADDAVLASGTVDSQGRAQLTVQSGGKPPQAYLRVTAPGHTPSVFEQGGGLWNPEQFTVLYPPDTLRQQAGKASVTWDQSKTLMTVSVRCSSTALAGAKVEIVPGSMLFYATDTGYDPGATATLKYGEATDFNVPPGPVEVRLTYQGHATSLSTRAESGTYQFVAANP